MIICWASWCQVGLQFVPSPQVKVGPHEPTFLGTQSSIVRVFKSGRPDLHQWSYVLGNILVSGGHSFVSTGWVDANREMTPSPFARKMLRPSATLPPDRRALLKLRILSQDSKLGEAISPQMGGFSNWCPFRPTPRGCT